MTVGARSTPWLVEASVAGDGHHTATESARHEPPDLDAWSDLTEAERLARVGELLRVTSLAGERDVDPPTLLASVARSVSRVLGWAEWRVWAAAELAADAPEPFRDAEADGVVNTAAAREVAAEAWRTGAPAVGEAAGAVVLGLPVAVGGRVEAVVGFTVGHGDQQVDAVLREVVEHVMARVGLVVERARHLAEVEAANVELRRSNAELEQFAYVASHDLQEPLRKVASYCALLQRRYSDVLDEDGQEFVAYAVDGAVRMKTLINDLLEYSRVGRSGHEPEAVALGPVVQEALSLVTTAIEESQARITVADGLPTVVGRRSELVALVYNLVSNAVKFRSSDLPRIQIDGGVEDDRVWLSVADNGVGIGPQHHERVFGVFQRLHGREEYAGTGIGLAMCRRIVETHGGTIRVDSGGADGTTMRVELPATSRAGKVMA